MLKQTNVQMKDDQQKETEKETLKEKEEGHNLVRVNVREWKREEVRQIWTYQNQSIKQLIYGEIEREVICNLKRKRFQNNKQYNSLNYK